MTEKTNIADIDFYFELIAKELSGEVSKEERKLLLDWVNKEEGNKVLYDQVKNTWKLSAVVQTNVPEFNMEGAWKSIKVKTIETESGGFGGGTKIGQYSTFFKVAASTILIAGIITLMKFTLWNTSAPELVAYSTQENELTVYLPDSSKVYLNKNSKLTYFTDYNTEDRKVSLEGEAFFEVKKAQGKTFEVHSLRSVTTVLGTSFNVRSLKNEPREIVQVVTGKVSFATNSEKSKNEVILLPGNRGVLDEKGLLTKTEINDPNFMAWKENRLAFDNTPMSEVKETIEAYFGIEIEVNDPILLNCRITGTFDAPVQEELLNALAVSTNSSFNVNGKKITMVGKGCNN